MFKKIVTVIVVVIFTGLAFTAFADTMVNSMDRGLIVKCNKLNEQSIEYRTDDFERPLFWISQEDKDLCGGVDINISAQVGNPYETNN